MRILSTLILILCATVGVYAQQPSADNANARVGELINASEYITLSRELPSLRDKLSKPLLALADAITAYHEGRFEDSNRAIDKVGEFAPELGGEVIFGMQNLALVNFLSLEDYKSALGVVQLLLLSLPEDDSAHDSRRNLESMSRWFSAMATRPTVEVERPKSDVVIPVEIRKMGEGEHLIVDVNVGDNVEDFIFDTGCMNANFISTAAAERLGVEIIADDILIRGVEEGYAKLGVLLEMHIGDVVIRNTTFFVVDKIVPENVEVEGLCEAVLGTHVIRKLGEVRFERDSERLVLPAEESAAPAERNMFFDSQYYICCQDGQERIVMQFDTGNTKTQLSSRYYNRFQQRIEQSGGEVERSRSGGFGGVEWRDTRTMPEVEFVVGATAVQLKKVAVNMPIKYEDGEPFVEQYDGVAGVDLLSATDVVTFDLKRMFYRVDK